MNRRKFFAFLGIGAAAAVVAPKMLASEPKTQDNREDIDWDAKFQDYKPCEHPYECRTYTRVALMKITVIWEKCGICDRMMSSYEVEREKEDEDNRGIPQLIRPAWFDHPKFKVNA
jgi:hypothetical protein